jgi:hypothetical protein
MKNSIRLDNSATQILKSINMFFAHSYIREITRNSSQNGKVCE